MSIPKSQFSTSQRSTLRRRESAVSVLLRPLSSRFSKWMNMEQEEDELPDDKTLMQQYGYARKGRGGGDGSRVAGEVERFHYPNGACSVSLSWSPLSHRFPVSVCDVSRHRRTQLIASICFVFFSALECVGIYLIVAYQSANPLKGVVPVLIGLAMLSTGLYISLGGGVGRWRLAVNPGYISPSGSEVDVSILNRLQPARIAFNKEDVTDSATGNYYHLHDMICSTCMRVKPLRGKHCHDCGRCVGRFDHHCHWLGACVGGGNRVSFFLLLIVMIISIGLGLILLMTTYSAVPAAMCSRWCSIGFVVTTALGFLQFAFVLLALGIQCAAMGANSSTYELFLVGGSDEKALSVINPRTRRREQLSDVLDFGALENCKQYFGGYVFDILHVSSSSRLDNGRRHSFDPINVGAELFAPSTDCQSNDGDVV